MIYPKTLIAVFALFAVSFGLGLFVHPWGELEIAPSGSEILGQAAPSEVRQILQSKCADCHSNQTRWPVYGRFAPASWLMEHDVHAGRTAVDFSRWPVMTSEERIAALTRAAAEIRTGEMPPRPYAFMHPGNRLSKREQQIVIDWARAERKRERSSNEQKRGEDKE